MTERRRTTKKATKKAATWTGPYDPPPKKAPTTKKAAAKPPLIKGFTIDFDDLTLVSEAVDELLNNANSYGQLTKATLEIELNANNYAIVEIEGSLPRGIVTFVDRSAS